ncbi:hypothetical protein GIB64_11610 [Pseudomonas lactis]|uniref:Rop family plasmid primer RNA-binding protein n=1 Tax=Pseudomonas fluorescens TaxID=294 RepID=A0A109KT71_PSEFL|nr:MULTISPECIES: hypothetical protein [Pseudomonas]KWV74961.1 hypothetical protein PFLuk1_00692 [Pseudomonas fluorescens]KWV77100.1 hypothetical protein PFLmoz3_06083 [Pseudomonas fluorescens]MBA5958077.1 hypothetical protein [Pseudomonas lactis]MBV2082403.1 hypothetical protein [Pseudomonas carnis]MBV2088113.1 hypothetical protein [Pseudomonas carnis]
MLNAPQIKQQLQVMGDLIQDMANVLEDGADDAPLAFFEACEDLQLQVTQLMHATFLAVQQKPEPKL